MRRFLSDTRAAAGITATLLSVMFLGGAALLVDHIWIVDHRDTLKNATDAAAVATTLRLATLTGESDDAAVEDELTRVAERYVRVNLLPNLPASARQRASDTLEVELPGFSRTTGVVEVAASADIGDTLLGELLGYDLPARMDQRAGTEAAITPTELVLAIDATGSMGYSLDGTWAPGRPESKMGMVKSAALELVDILADRTTAGTAPVAVGIVPWHHRVQLGGGMRSRWESRGWVEYLDERTYPNPYDGARPNPSGATALTVTLPAQPGTWHGCLDQRSTNGTDPPAFTAEHPADVPFSMNFYTSHSTYPQDQDVSFACDASRAQHNHSWNLCYDDSAVPLADRAGPSYAPYNKLGSQQGCNGGSGQVIHPLDTDLAAVERAINNLQDGGSATYSTLGVAWGIRLLDPDWREVWGNAVHPMDTTDAQGVQKVLVLLTDGDDNHHDRSVTDRHRRTVCSNAKAAGIRIFTIAAMDESHGDHDHLARELERCSSQADDPEGSYVFVNNATREDLEEAFRAIGGQLLVMRRIY